jgi:hypothetical protein
MFLCSGVVSCIILRRGTRHADIIGDLTALLQPLRVSVARELDWKQLKESMDLFLAR